ncbi:hypothetical protein BSV1_D03 (plasmid) [Borreliella finlandensis]|uniref:Uncharacterized protein n=1 Tax=Borreliella finlandensis TaxID=498741 RepID=A0A806C6R0_9SPIR|nr:hypothetical protein BSV1_D03 [Borreliella finlandensis]
MFYGCYMGLKKSSTIQFYSDFMFVNFIKKFKTFNKVLLY